MATIEEIRALIPNLKNAKLEMLAHGTEWFLSEDEMIERQKYIDEAQRYWIDNKTVKPNYFENPIVKGQMDYFPFLRPITIQMIEDYIAGIVFLPRALKDEKLSPIVNRLTKPALDKVAGFKFSGVHQNHVINRIVPKKESISIEILPGVSDIKNKREALKGYIKDKLIYPTESKITELIMDFSIHQKKIYNHLYKEKTGQTLTGYACSLDHETVKEIYYIMSDKGHIKANLDDFLAVFSKTAKTVNKPIEWLILNERGTNSNRGNQTALFIFLNLMLGKISNEHLRKAKDLFIDKKGAFIKESLLKPDKSKISTYGFETPIKEIIKKADQ